MRAASAVKYRGVKMDAEGLEAWEARLRQATQETAAAIGCAPEVVLDALRRYHPGYDYLLPDQKMIWPVYQGRVRPPRRLARRQHHKTIRRHR